MQEEIEQVYFYQTRPYFFLYKCKVIKTWENRYMSILVAKNLFILK